MLALELSYKMSEGAAYDVACNLASSISRLLHAVIVVVPVVVRWKELAFMSKSLSQFITENFRLP